MESPRFLTGNLGRAVRGISFVTRAPRLGRLLASDVRMRPSALQFFSVFLFLCSPVRPGALRSAHHGIRRPGSPDHWLAATSHEQLLDEKNGWIAITYSTVAGIKMSTKTKVDSDKVLGLNQSERPGSSFGLKMERSGGWALNLYDVKYVR